MLSGRLGPRSIPSARERVPLSKAASRPPSGGSLSMTLDGEWLRAGRPVTFKQIVSHRLARDHGLGDFGNEDRVGDVDEPRLGAMAFHFGGGERHRVRP